MCTHLGCQILQPEVHDHCATNITGIGIWKYLISLSDKHSSFRFFQPLLFHWCVRVSTVTCLFPVSFSPLPRKKRFCFFLFFFNPFWSKDDSYGVNLGRHCAEIFSSPQTETSTLSTRSNKLETWLTFRKRGKTSFISSRGSTPEFCVSVSQQWIQPPSSAPPPLLSCMVW